MIIKIYLIFTVMILIIVALSVSCTSDDPWTETIYFQDAIGQLVDAETIVSENGTIEIIRGENVTTELLSASNATIVWVQLTNLPESDPGIPGVVWSDNGTLKVSK